MSQDPLQEYPRSAAQVLRSRHPAFRAASQWPRWVAPLCPIRPRHFVAGPTPNETNETTCRYKNAFSATTSVSCVPFPDTISAHIVIPSGTKAGHQGPLTFSACPSTLSLLRWNQPSSTPQLYDWKRRHATAPPEGHGRPASQRPTTKASDFSDRAQSLRSPAIAQISLKSATKKRAADTSSLQSMKSSYAAYEAHGGAKSVGPAP